MREARGLRAYRWSAALNRLARVHSSDMARRDYFSHVNPEGEGPNDRVERLDLNMQQVPGMASGLAENLFYTHRYHRTRTITDANGTRQHVDWKTTDELAAEAVRGWIKSPGHRANLLDTDFREHAIGIAHAEDDRVFVTQNLSITPVGPRDTP